MADYLVCTKAHLMSRPTSGSAWNYMKGKADATMPALNLSNQDSTTVSNVFAAALVYARTGDQKYADKVKKVLAAAPNQSLTNSTIRVLSVGRQMAGLAMSADLIGYKGQNATFDKWIGGMRDQYIPNHGRWTSISQCAGNVASNWGAWALSSLTAINGYMQSTTGLSKCNELFKGWTGATRYTGFVVTGDFDKTWASVSPWLPINPAGSREDGAIVEDASRSAGSAPTLDATGAMYSWETFNGIALVALLLHNSAGVDPYPYGNKALLRAGQWLVRRGKYPPQYSSSNPVIWLIHDFYGVDLGTKPAATTGRQFGYTDWLFG